MSGSLSIVALDSVSQPKVRTMIKRLAGLDQPAALQMLVSEAGICLRKEGSRFKGLQVNFDSAASSFRRRKGGGKSQLLVKAVGLHKAERLRIIDATAGLGKDSFVLASLGGTMTMLERSPLLSLLLEEAIQAGCVVPDIADIVGRMQVHNCDAIEWLHETGPSSDVVYLDPMFPTEKKGALVKGDMQLMREIIGTDIDAGRLFEVALASPTRRVVVKRAARSRNISPLHPDFSVKGRSSRFDVYIKTEHS